MTELIEALEKIRIAKIDERGRIYIPVVVRDKLHIKMGEEIYLRMENDHLAIYPKGSIKRRLIQTQSSPSLLR